MGLARTGLIVGRHPHDPAISLVAVTKTNLTAAPDPLAFRMKSFEQSVVVDWLGPKAGTADDAVRTPERAEPPGVVRATLWLLDALAQGERPAAELLAAARADGIKERTLDRAKRSLGIESKFINVPGKGRAWLWCPPKEKMNDRDSLDELILKMPPIVDPIRSDLPENMSNETSEILDRERFDWAVKNLNRG